MRFDPGRGPGSFLRMHGCEVRRCDAWLPGSAYVCRRCKGLIPVLLWAAVWRTWDGGRGWGSEIHTRARVAAASAAGEVLAMRGTHGKGKAAGEHRKRAKRWWLLWMA